MLGDLLRWLIVELHSTEQLCVAHLAEEFQTAQPLVSHHLKVLRQAGLIKPDRYRYWDLLPAPTRRPGPPGRRSRPYCPLSAERDRLPAPDPRH